MHTSSCLVPVARSSLDRLKKDWIGLVTFVKQSGMSIDDEMAVIDPAIAVCVRQSLNTPLNLGNSNGWNDNEARRAAASAVEEAVLEGYRTSRTAVVEPVDPVAVPHQQFFRIDKDQLDESIFDNMWGRGVPVIVDRVNESFKLEWSPAAFIRRARESNDPQDQNCCKSARCVKRACALLNSLHTSH